MNIEERIKELEEERDHLLATTPDEIIKPKDPNNRYSHAITTHTRIKNHFKNLIMNLRTWNDPEIRKKREKGLAEAWTVERRKRGTKIADPEVRKKSLETIKKRYGVSNASKAKEIKELNEIELEKKLAELKQELFNLRFQLAVNQLENPTRIRAVRKEIAICKTIQREREIAATRREEN